MPSRSRVLVMLASGAIAVTFWLSAHAAPAQTAPACPSTMPVNGASCSDAGNVCSYAGPATGVCQCEDRDGHLRWYCQGG